MLKHGRSVYVTADDLPVGCVTLRELEALQTLFGGTMGYGGVVADGVPMTGPWLRLPKAREAEVASAVEQLRSMDRKKWLSSSP